MKKVVKVKVKVTEKERYMRLKNKFKSLIPLTGKRPFVSGWDKYCKEPSPFEWKDFKGHNIGIPTGPCNEILVVDVDDDELFEDFILENRYPLPNTRTHKTGNRGMHLLFKYPNDGSEYRCRAFKKFGFDVRGNGGQVVAPGSIHPETGKRYTVAVNLPMAEAPLWLKNMCKEVKNEK